MHYIGRLQSTGAIFDSSRSRGKEFTFNLGQHALPSRHMPRATPKLGSRRLQRLRMGRCALGPDGCDVGCCIIGCGAAPVLMRRASIGRGGRVARHCCPGRANRSVLPSDGGGCIKCSRAVLSPDGGGEEPSEASRASGGSPRPRHVGGVFEAARLGWSSQRGHKHTTPARTHTNTHKCTSMW